MQLTTLVKHWLIHQLINSQVPYVAWIQVGYDMACAIEENKMWWADSSYTQISIILEYMLFQWYKVSTVKRWPVRNPFTTDVKKDL